MHEHCQALLYRTDEDAREDVKSEVGSKGVLGDINISLQSRNYLVTLYIA